MNWKSLIPSLVPVLTVVGGLLAPVVQHFVSAHPMVALVAGAVLGVINHWLPSPASQQ